MSNPFTVGLPQLAGLGAINVQTFTSSGTWRKPMGASFWMAFAIAPGAGGGSGARQATATARCGGGGGAPGQVGRTFGSIADLGATETVTMGAAGTGGASVVADTTVGNAGVAGGDCSFGAHLMVKGGGAGGGGTTADNTGTAGTGFRNVDSFCGVVPVAVQPQPLGGIGRALAGGFAGAPTDTTNGMLYPTGGAGAGGASAGSTVSVSGQTGGAITIGTAVGGSNLTVIGGAIGIAGTPAGNGVSAAVGDFFPGTGGGGGFYQTGTIGGAGGNGGRYGAGGGGGAASDNGFASGKGGDGALGIMVVICW